MRTAALETDLDCRLERPSHSGDVAQATPSGVKLLQEEKWRVN